MPVHIQDKVGQEIQKLIHEGHVVKFNKCTSEYFISPIVITAKKDGSVKLAMDAKPMNEQIHKNHYQMPNLLELLDSAAQIITSDISGDVWFTSLDLKYAFSQIPLSEEVSRHCNFNIVCGEQTGTYRFKTGFYGLTDMPKEFQKAMDNTLQGLSGVFCFLDDILIVSKGSVEDHNILVDKVISRLDKEGFALKFSKCEFSLNQLSWLGYDIDSEGCRPKSSKIEAVLALEPPRTLKQLRSFMGILNHLQQFLPNLQVHSDQLRPSLTAGNKSKFVWGECQQMAFSNILQLIANITKMYHYDQSRNSRVKCDASHSGLGAALEQEIEEDVWVPIAFASRFLNDQEKKYSTNELELLAIVWSCEHFQTYLLGNHFVILTDHKAIISALKTNRGNKTYQSRLTRWADRLLPFDFDIFHISGCKLRIVDYLSRFPTFEAPRPSSFDEQYVVKCISRFFDACEFLDGCARHYTSTEELSDTPEVCQDYVVPDQINLVELLGNCQSRINCPDTNSSLVASNKFGNIPVEGVLIQDIQSTSKGLYPLEGDKMIAISQNNSSNLSIPSPLEGVQRVGSYSSQSALSINMPNFATFSAWITIYLPILISLWIITLAVSGCHLLSLLINLFVLFSSYRIGWSAVRLLNAFHFQTAMNPNTSTNNTNDSFEQLLNQYLPVTQHWFSSDRARPRFRAGAVRPRRSSTVQRGVELRSQYARILANFRAKRGRIPKQQSQSVNSLEILKSPVVAADQKLLTGLVGILDSDVLSELTDEDASLNLMKRAIINRDYEGFCRIDSYVKSFWHCAAVVDGCVVVDNRIAIPMCLRKSLLSRLHRSHAGQLAMVDAAQYIWWPRMHRDIIQLCKDCPQCTKFGKNLKANVSFNSSKPLPLLSSPNEELQLDYAGPLLDSFGNSIYMLVAIDRYSKYPSAMITRSTGGRKIIKFLKSYIQQHSIPKSIKTDQYSGFKNKLVQKFCLEKNIAQYFCPVGDHRGCGLVERSIQTIKRRLGASQLSSDFYNVQDTLRNIIEDIRVTKNSVTGVSPFELHFGRPPNTELSTAADRLSSGIHLDNQRLERDLLTPEQRREQCDSRPRIKVVKKGQSSPTVSPHFGGTTDSVADTPHYRALESLAQSANQWLSLKKSLTHQEGVKALKTLTERNQILAATLRSNLSAGTLRFRNQMPTEQIRPSLPKRNLDYLVLNEPNKVEIFRKFLNRKSGRELFKPYKGKIVRITESTYISDKGKVIRRNHLAVRLKSTQLSFSGKQLTPVKKGQKRPIVPSSTSSSEDNRPLKQSGSRQRISAKTVYVPAHSKFPFMPVSHTPPRSQMVASKLREDATSEAPGIQNIPYPQHSTPV